jgi:hypothetical protein
VFRSIDPSAFNGVIVQIIKFLQHHFIAPNLLRMRAFLPHLALTFGFVRGTEILKLIQQPLNFFGLDLLENSLRV